MDENISIGTGCYSQDEAVEIAENLNKISERWNLKYKYYVVMV